MHSPGVLLFVYGTLQTGSEHPNGALLRENAELLGSGRIQARLYIINDPDDPGQNFYPGAVPSAKSCDKVFGEVYRITKPEIVFPVLDDYEACSENWPEPHEFIQRKLLVSLDDGTAVTALSYIYSWDVSSAEHVVSGRYERLAANVR